MKPDWDQLSSAFEGHQALFVAEVDCTAQGKSKCDELGIRGFPTLKYGDPHDLQEYKGSRAFGALKRHADRIVPKECGPETVDMCDAEQAAQIEEFKAMPPSARRAYIQEHEASIQQVETDFADWVESINEQFTEEEHKKNQAIEAIKAQGLNLAKAVDARQQRSPPNRGRALPRQPQPQQRPGVPPAARQGRPGRPAPNNQPAPRRMPPRKPQTARRKGHAEEL